MISTIESMIVDTLGAEDGENVISDVIRLYNMIQQTHLLSSDDIISY